MSSADERRPLAVRVVVLLALVAVLVLVVVAVVRADIDRRNEDPTAAAAAASTYVPPPAPVDGEPSITAGSVAPLPPPGPLTGTSLAVELQKVAQRETGWTHKVWCDPAGELAVGDVLSCTAETEPPIEEVAPSRFLVVVVDDDTAVWTRGRSGPLSVDLLLTEPDRTCASLLDGGYPYVSTLAWWWVHDRPASLLEGGARDRPCVQTYGQEVVDAVDAAAVGPDLIG